MKIPTSKLQITDKILAMKRVISMSIPLVSSRVGSAVTSFIGMLMIAKLGHDQLAAGALINSVSFAFLVPIWSLFFAVGVIVGHAFGAQKENDIGKIVRQGLWLGIIIGIPATALLCNISPILVALGQEKKLAFLTQEYFRAYSFGLIPTLWFSCISQSAAGISKQKLTLAFTLISIPLIIIFGYTLTFGKFGCPQLGIKGMGYSYAISYIIEDILIVLYFYNKKEYKKYNIFAMDLKIDPQYLKQLFQLGWPVVAMTAGELIVFSLSTIFIGWINADQLAAQQITLQINLIVFMIPYGIATAATVLISQEMGRKNYHSIRNLGYTAITLSTLTTLIFLGIYLIMPKSLVSLYLNVNDPINSEIVAISIPLLAITGVMNIFDAVRTVASFALRGMRDTFIPMIVFVVLGCIISLPIGCWLAFTLHYGVLGIRWGFVIGFLVGAVILVHRFHKFSALEFIAGKY